jgi:hypothetical protein
MNLLALLPILFFGVTTLRGIQAQSAAALPARIPTLQRLDVSYLKQAHHDVAELDSLQKPVSLKTGLNDYRSIIHAHSNLSHDSRGTIDEIAAAAKLAHVDAVFLTNHPKTDVDVISAGAKGVIAGILFVPGTEANGFLAFPGDGKMHPLNVSEQELVNSIGRSNGLIFVAHPEEHKDWSLKGLTGTEIYNTHADLKDEQELLTTLKPTNNAGYARLFAVLNAMSLYPQEAFACLFDAPTENLKHYDELSKSRSYAATAGNDSHQNTGFILRGLGENKVAVEDPLGERLGTIDLSKSALVRTLLGEPVIGKELMRRVLDPYPVSFHYVSTHVLAKEKTSEALWRALREGRTYVGFDWIADPTGTAFIAGDGRNVWNIGDAVTLSPKLNFKVGLPIPANIRLMRDGNVVSKTVGRELRFTPTEPGVYRVEASVMLAGEERPWIYTGAIRVSSP